MSKKGSQSAQKRALQEQARQQKLQQEKKQTIILISVTLALIALIVGGIVLAVVLSNRPIYDLADKDSYTVSDTATNYVKLNVSYTDEAIDEIVKRGVSAQYGAREIQRVIDNSIKKMFVKKIVDGNAEGEYKVDIENGEFVLKEKLMAMV